MTAYPRVTEAHHVEVLRKIVAAYDRLTVARRTRQPGAQTDANRALRTAIRDASALVHGAQVSP
jgi:hypothetical protein